MPPKDLDKEVAIAGFQLADKLGKQCVGHPAYAVMFAIAALAAGGVRQRISSVSLDEAISLHINTVAAISMGTFNDLAKEALKKESPQQAQPQPE